MNTRRASQCSLLFALACGAKPASAQGAGGDFGTYGAGSRGRPTESPQDRLVEIRIGRYVPSVDDEFKGGDAPYRRVFGTKNRYSFGFEVDWQALRIPYFGTLGPGVGLAYTKLSGRGFLTDSPSVRASEESSLTIVPLHALAVLRADVLARETPVPLVPYGKLGIGGAFWSVGDGVGTARSEEGVPPLEVVSVVGRGFSYGPQFAVGGMLLLDAFDPSAAVVMDADTGINNAYAFLEWSVSVLDGFGAGNQMQVGTNTWVLGLALEI